MNYIQPEQNVINYVWPHSKRYVPMKLKSSVLLEQEWCYDDSTRFFDLGEVQNIAIAILCFD